MLTDEQQPIVEFNGDDKIIVVFAYAGSGKTFTLKEFAKRRPKEKMLYLAYNKGIREKAEREFPKNVTCKTTHQVAFLVGVIDC